MRHFILLCVLASFVVGLQSGARAIAAPLKDQEVDGKAENHEHWEHIVRKRSAFSRFDSLEDDDTAHIVDVQEYYRNVFEEEWKGYRDNEKDLFNMLKSLELASVQGEGSHTLELGVHSRPIKGRYIVMFQSDADDYVLDRTIEILEKANRDSNQRVRATDIHPLRNIKGFTATLNRKTVELLTKHPVVAHIEEDAALRRSSITIPSPTPDASIESNRVPWNLDRLDQHANSLDGLYTPEARGKNVAIYIIDTGVRATHQELAGRVHYAGFDAVDHLTGTHNYGKDCNGHGTHCAGTAAGKTYGVAKEAEIYNLRALNCHGTGAVSGIVMGIDKIVAHHLENRNGMPAVISQSLGVHKSESLNSAIERAMNAGITMVGAAGNQGDYGCKYSPASAKVGIAVGATDQSDSVTMFTNIGECTDIMAPGTQITSASSQCDTCTKTMSGTSMAAPHAAGYAAIILSLHPQMSAKDVKRTMMERATKGAVKMTALISSRKGANETPNRLLYVPAVEAHDSDIEMTIEEENIDETAIYQEAKSRP